MKTINTISKVILGIIFIFSGFVKGVDPLGTTYKFVDYFVAFGFDFMQPLALPLAFLLNAIEFLIGISLLFNAKIKYSSWAVLFFMSFFTLLTFFLAIYNPVSDCGCFGDAIIMTNWQTFFKNIIIMIITIVVFVNRNKYEEKISKSVQLGVLGVGIIFIIGVSSYCYKHLPIVDFRPYKIGTDIQEKMIIPVDAPQAEYKTILEYKKNNEIKEFSIDNLPDSTWEWVSSQNILIEEGYVPPIHDFNINTLDGNDITDIVLNEDKFTFILVAYDLAISDIENIKSIEYVYKYCKGTTNCNFIALTSSLNDDISKFKKENRASFPFYNTDEITLKTIVRSNPGLVLIKNGIILNKWHNNDIPGIQNLKKDFLTNKKFNSNIDKNKRTKLNA